MKNLNVNRLKLKVKNKSLADEARVIKLEEKKLKKKSKNTTDLDFKRKLGSAIGTLKGHRKYVVGFESRATQLAIAFLKGMPYEQVEQKRKQEKEYHFRCNIVKRACVIANNYKFGFKTREELDLRTQKEVDTAFYKWVGLDK